MRDYSCFIYHYEDKKLVQNGNQACWAGLNRTSAYYNKSGKDIVLDEKTKKHIYIRKYIEKEITDLQRKRIVYLVNKITSCKFVKIKNETYVQYKLLNNFYSNLLLLNLIRILWYKNGGFNNKQFFIDICKRKTIGLDYLEFIMTCIKNNVEKDNSWSYGDHSFVYLGIIPKKKEALLKYKKNSMQSFLQSK